MIFPDLFVVLSMLNIFRGVGSSFIPNPIFIVKFGCMKLSVAPESTSARLSAMKQLVQIDTGILIEPVACDVYRVTTKSPHPGRWVQAF
jgi:hypothetical protein